ncbi:MAG: protein-tyrosine-phosphatase [Rhodothalassiaceae bacterium]|nr:MAG: protein-tyrosine-phosphatase [Rhodothalassiaceae bacterium]
MVKVLFLCMGNICRSPMAHGVLATLAERAGLADGPRRLLVDSAGTSDYHIGEAPDPRAVEVAREYGVEIGHLRARQVTREDLADFDYIIGMERENLKRLKALVGPAAMETARAEQRLLLSFAPDVPLDEVPDPYYGSIEDFHRCFDLIERGVAGLFAHIARTHFDGAVSLR